MMNAASSFRQRMLAGDKLVGTFLKTPTSHATEILGELGYDFVVIDQEHSPFAVWLPVTASDIRRRSESSLASARSRAAAGRRYRRAG